MRLASTGCPHAGGARSLLSGYACRIYFFLAVAFFFGAFFLVTFFFGAVFLAALIRSSSGVSISCQENTACGMSSAELRACGGAPLGWESRRHFQSAPHRIGCGVRDVLGTCCRELLAWPGRKVGIDESVGGGSGGGYAGGGGAAHHRGRRLDQRCAQMSWSVDLWIYGSTILSLYQPGRSSLARAVKVGKLNHRLWEENCRTPQTSERYEYPGRLLSTM